MLGSWGVQSSDPDLNDKLAALKASRKTPNDAVRDFLRTEVGVDPDTLPMTFQDAVDYLTSLAWTNDWSPIELVGSSLGFKHAVVSSSFSERATWEAGNPNLGRIEDAYRALTRQYPDFYTFTVSDGNVKPAGQSLPRWKTATKYPPGSLLRIAKKSNPTITMIVRIGGLTDETTPTELDTMKPVDTRDWAVTEEL